MHSHINAILLLENQFKHENIVILRFHSITTYCLKQIKCLMSKHCVKRDIIKRVSLFAMKQIDTF